MKLIAKNGNFYTVSRIPSDFWQRWKESKDEMKAEGYSPFKRNGEWFVSKFSKEKANSDQIANFHDEQLEFFLDNLNLEPENSEQAEVMDHLNDCETITEAVSVLKCHSELFNDVEKLINNASDALFERNLNED